MTISKAFFSLAGGTVATLALAGMAQAFVPPAVSAYTDISSTGTTTVTGTSFSSTTAPVIGPSAFELGPGFYDTAPLNGTGAVWVTASADSAGIPQSVTNGGTFDFTSQAFNTPGSVITPYTVTGTVETDNALLGIDLEDSLGNILATAPGTGESNSDFATFQDPFSFTPLSGTDPGPDQLVFIVSNQLQTAPTSTSNPASIRYEFTVAPATPEPGSVAPFALGGLGLLGLALRARRARVAA